MEIIDYDEKTINYINLIKKIDDDLLTESLYSGLSEITEFIPNSKIPITLETLLLITSSSNFLKCSIFDISISQDIYSSAVLYRALIELYIKSYYLFTNFILCNDDSFSKNFRMISEAAEIINTYKVGDKQNKIYGSPKEKYNPYDYIEAAYPIFKGSSKNKINAKINQHSFNNMLKFIINYYKNSKGKEALPKTLISDYSTLSSYIHGGEFSRIHSIFCSNPENRFIEIKKTVDMTYFFSLSIKLHLFLIASKFDNKFIKYVDLLLENIILENIK
ncbi:MAG: hypothetical protein ACPKMZ_12390 [Pleomorphochaeta sp.]